MTLVFLNIFQLDYFCHGTPIPRISFPFFFLFKMIKMLSFLKGGVKIF